VLTTVQDSNSQKTGLSLRLRCGPELGRSKVFHFQFSAVKAPIMGGASLTDSHGSKGESGEADILLDLAETDGVWRIDHSLMDGALVDL
jgi:hypothetical protein